MNIAVVILAAGKASRMGSVKQLLPYKNSTLLQFVINQALNSKASKVYCVLGANANIIKEKTQDRDVTFIHNSNWETGISSSIVSAVNHLQNLEILPDAALIMLVDQPNVDSNYINELINLHQKYQDLIIASVYGNINGVPAIFPSNYFENLLKLKGDKGAKVFLNRNEETVIRLVSKVTEILADIDSPEDYQRLIKKTLK